MEIWKDVAEYEGIYQVSSYGRVRSVNRIRIVKDSHGGEMLRTDKGKVRRLNDNGKGYLVVRLQKGDKNKRNYYVHRLVASAFCERPNGCDVVNHKNGDTRDNRSDNLEWCTQRENVRYAATNMRKPKSTCKKSTTGERYIHIRDARGQRRYRVSIQTKGMSVCREFTTLEEAIAFRNEVTNQ